MGRATYTEFAADYKQVLRDVGVTGKVQAHRQTRGETPEGVEYLLRAAEGPDYPERKEALDRIERLLALDDRQDLLDREPTPTGEVLFVGVAPSDTLGDLIDQMYDTADALVMCANIAKNGVLAMTILEWACRRRQGLADARRERLDSGDGGERSAPGELGRPAPAAAAR